MSRNASLSTVLAQRYKPHLVWDAWAANASDEAMTVLTQERRHPNTWNWQALSKNPAAHSLLCTPLYRKYIHWDEWVFHPHDEVFAMGLPYVTPLSRCHCISLSKNPAAWSWITHDHQRSQVCWYALCGNPHSQLSSWLEDHWTDTDAVLYKGPLSSNAAAVPFLQQHPTFVDWSHASSNPQLMDLLSLT